MHIHVKSIYKPVIGLILIACLSVSCDKQQQEAKIKQITWEDFQNFLTRDTDYQTIVGKFGEPARDIGSGIHIYVYELSDSTEIWIGYVSKIMYARHMDKNHNVLHYLI
jgi:hypothetical protein